MPSYFLFPQGAQVGPQGFSYCTDPVPVITEKHGVPAHLYADDTNLYLPFSLTDNDAQEEVFIMEGCIDDT